MTEMHSWMWRSSPCNMQHATQTGLTMNDKNDNTHTHKKKSRWYSCTQHLILSIISLSINYFVLFGGKIVFASPLWALWLLVCGVDTVFRLETQKCRRNPIWFVNHLQRQSTSLPFVMAVVFRMNGWQARMLGFLPRFATILNSSIRLYRKKEFPKHNKNYRNNCNAF